MRPESLLWPTLSDQVNYYDYCFKAFLQELTQLFELSCSVSTVSTARHLKPDEYCALAREAAAAFSAQSAASYRPSYKVF